MKAIGEHIELMVHSRLRREARNRCSLLTTGVRIATFAVSLVALGNRVEAVELSMRDTTFSASVTLWVAINADSILESQNVLSYQFVLQFDSAVLAGVGGDAEGTITEPFGSPFTSGDTYPGELRLAAAGIQPVSGYGSFVVLLLRASSDAGGSTVIRFGSALLNEGDPPTTYQDTLATIVAEAPDNAGPRNYLPEPSALTVVPNPAHDRVTLHVSSPHQSGPVTLWNMLGQSVGTYRVDGQKLEIFLGTFPAGTYFVTLGHHPAAISRILVLH